MKHGGIIGDLMSFAGSDRGISFPKLFRSGAYSGGRHHSVGAANE
jgi:hypothetical protein